MILPWQQNLWQKWQSLQTQNKIAHAVVLYGIGGIGKQSLAIHFAQSLLCHSQKRPCLSCASCLSFASVHPDLHTVAENEKSLKIDAIREAQSFFESTSHFKQNKICLLPNAHRLTNAAANALLKTLEEPLPNRYLILTCEQMTLLPATLRSRCQLWYCPPVVQKEAVAWLTGQGVEAEQIKQGLSLFPGAPFSVLQLQTLSEKEIYLGLPEQLEALQAGKISAQSLAQNLAKVDLLLLLELFYRFAAQALSQAAIKNGPNSSIINNWIELLAYLQTQFEILKKGTVINTYLILMTLFIQWPKG